jgi:hypothetical protein
MSQQEVSATFIHNSAQSIFGREKFAAYRVDTENKNKLRGSVYKSELCFLSEWKHQEGLV